MSVPTPPEELEYSRVWTDPDAFPSLSYSKNWTIQEDFPTVETDEVRVRADMQALYTEIKDYINGTNESGLPEEQSWEGRGLRQYTVDMNGSEEGRRTAEAQRILNEEGRVAAEEGRVLAEEGRVSAEEGRVSAENARNVWENYNDLKTYVPGNKVYYLGSSYVCKATATGVVPTDTTYWQIVAKVGGDATVDAHNADPTAHANLYIHAGQKGGTTLGERATAEGRKTEASGDCSHAEGDECKASDTAAHAEGFRSYATGSVSHAEGMSEASGPVSHAEGQNTTSSGQASHAEGTGTIANHRSQHVFGEYNTADTSSEAATARGDYVEIVGNGTNPTASHRSNARTLDWDGNEWLAGKLTMEGTPTADKDAATKKYVDDGLSGKAPTNHATSATTYGKGSNVNYGHLKLSDSTSSTSGTTDGTAATPSAVKAAYDLAAACVPQIGKGVSLLRNAHFYRPVNQRGIALNTWVNATSPASYNFIDGWKLTSGRAKLTASGVALEGTMVQVLEFAPYGAVIGSVLTTTGNLVPQFDAATRTFTITGTGETLVAAKLERGTAQTLYSGTTLLDEAPDYGEELAKCQRYLCKFSQYQDFTPCTSATTDVYVTIPVPLAKQPTIINANNIGGGTGWYVVVWQADTNQLRLRSLTNIGASVECAGDVFFSAE